MGRGLHEAGRRFLSLVREDIVAAAPSNGGIASGLARLDTVMALESFAEISCTPQRTVGCKWVEASAAILQDTKPELARLIEELIDELSWHANAAYPEDKFAPGYFDEWAFAQVIGPDGLFSADDLMLGMFAMGPNLFYPKHNHAAPELYYQLTGTHKWQSEDGPWVTRASPMMIWHEAFEVHATETLEEPFLSIWMWSEDTQNWPVLV